MSPVFPDQTNRSGVSRRWMVERRAGACLWNKEREHYTGHIQSLQCCHGENEIQNAELQRNLRLAADACMGL